MNIINAFLLGLIQGLTEFLPISSSAHLVIAQHLMDFDQPGVLFDVVLHAATSLAVIIYFRETIFNSSREEIKLLIIGIIPAGVLGFLFQDFFEELFSDIFLVGVTLIVTGAMNYFVDRTQARRGRINSIDAFIIGVAQAIAIIPGISRSSATIFAGTSLGVDRKKVAEYSFILSVPTIIGANALQIFTHGGGNVIPFSQYLAGFLSAFIVGFVSISILLRLLVEKKFKIFAAYAVILGVLTLVLQLG